MKDPPSDTLRQEDTAIGVVVTESKHHLLGIELTFYYFWGIVIIDWRTKKGAVRFLKERTNSEDMSTKYFGQFWSMLVIIG